MTDKKQLLRATDDAAIAQARMLVRSAPFGALSVLEPETGHPSISRVLLATDYDGVPVILVSKLATHTRALEADPRCALMVGEPGKGDPLASARLMIRCRAQQVDRNHENYRHIRTRFERYQPKSKLYIDFADFHFYKLNFVEALLNGGFGKAFSIKGEDLGVDSPIGKILARHEDTLLDLLRKSLMEEIHFSVKKLKFSTRSNWIPCGIDAGGMDLRQADKRLRVEFWPEIRNLDVLNTILETPFVITTLIEQAAEKNGHEIQ